MTFGDWTLLTVLALGGLAAVVDWVLSRNGPR